MMCSWAMKTWHLSPSPCFTATIRDCIDSSVLRLPAMGSSSISTVSLFLSISLSYRCLTFSICPCWIFLHRSLMLSVFFALPFVVWVLISCLLYCAFLFWVSRSCFMLCAKRSSQTCPITKRIFQRNRVWASNIKQSGVVAVFVSRTFHASDDQVRRALLDLVSERCCYGKSAAKNMVISKIVTSSAFHVGSAV